MLRVTRTLRPKPETLDSTTPVATSQETKLQGRVYRVWGYIPNPDTFIPLWAPSQEPYVRFESRANI